MWKTCISTGTKSRYDLDLDQTKPYVKFVLGAFIYYNMFTFQVDGLIHLVIVDTGIQADKRTCKNGKIPACKYQITNATMST